MTLEHTINRAIRDGNRLAEGGLGTILPDPRQLAIADAIAEEQRDLREERLIEALPGADCRRIGGELRCYVSPTVYAVAGRRGVQWFETRADGDYAIRGRP
jgi:hypothetical protein